MVETRRSSSSSKRQAASSPSTSGPAHPKRTKGESPNPSPSEPVQASPDPHIADEAPKKVIDTEMTPAEAEIRPPEDSPEQSTSPSIQLQERCLPAEEEHVSKILELPMPLAKKKTSKSSHRGSPWGKLLSECPENPHKLLRSSVFTVGNNPKCNLYLRDISVSSNLCKLRLIEHGGSLAAILETHGSKGIVQVNGKTIEKNCHAILRSGDEVLFNLTGRHAYIFQLIVNENASMSLPGTQSATEKVVHVTTRSGDPSAVAGASILASLSNPGQDLTAMPIPSPNNENVQDGLERPAARPCEVSDNCIEGAETHPNVVAVAHCSKHEGGSGFPSEDKDQVLPTDSAGVANHGCQQNNVGLDTHVDAENMNTVDSNLDLRPLLGALAGSSKVELELSESVLKMLEDRGELFKEFGSHSALPSNRCQIFKDGLKKGILRACDINVTFDNFPYFLSDNTKDVLLSAAYIHLECKEFSKYTSEIASASQRILLSGQTGSEIYQETLTKALAKHFNASLLIVESLLQAGGQNPKDSESLKDGTRGERSVIHVKRSTLMCSAHHKRLSATEVDNVGTSTVNSQSLPKQEASTATSKNYTFKEGDRIKYVGFLHTSGASHGLIVEFLHYEVHLQQQQQQQQQQTVP